MDHSVKYNEADLALNPVQTHITAIMSAALFSQGVYDIVHGRGSSALRAQKYVRDLRSEHLPDNQWQIEVTGWFATSLAKLQRSMLEYATGPSNISDASLFIPPPDDISRDLCHSQMLPSARDTISFSIANLSIVLLISAILIVTSLYLDTVVGCIQRKVNARNHKRLQWIMDSKLQLQRQAFEGAGMGEWSGGTDTVPVTTRREKFSTTSEATDPQHPRLQRYKNEAQWNGEGASLLGSPEGRVKIGNSVDTQSVAGS